MTSKNTIWVRKKKKMLIKLFGGKCMFCGKETDLEFAHIRPTKVVGLGRGSYKRIKDVIEKPHSYILLCKECHRAFDNGKREYMRIQLLITQFLDIKAKVYERRAKNAKNE